MSDPILRASVIICAYTQERWNSLVAAVGSIRGQKTPAGEILIVIDYNPALYEMARVQFPDARVMENTGPKGLSGARNTGVENARYPLVAFMDEDAIAERDWLDSLLVHYQDEQVIGVGGTVAPHWLGERPAWFADEFAWVVGCTYKGLPERVEPVRNLLGCNMSFRREVFDRAGGFRDSLGRLGSKNLLSCEETEFCIRAARRYPQSWFIHEPRARVNHEVPSYRGTWGYYRTRCYAEGLSKALVSNYVGSGDGLASERKYTLQVLPQGIWRGLKDSVVTGNLAGLRQAGAILAGLAITSLGYLVGRVTARTDFAEASSNKVGPSILGHAK